jgi:hypothetical protein
MEVLHWGLGKRKKNEIEIKLQWQILKFFSSRR